MIDTHLIECRTRVISPRAKQVLTLLAAIYLTVVGESCSSLGQGHSEGIPRHGWKFLSGKSIEHIRYQWNVTAAGVSASISCLYRSKI